MNFYKITNEKENHHGLQYKTGLNVDPLKFNPSGDCKPGGIYFSKEDILAFLSYGPWIRKVTIPEDAKIYENPNLPVKWKADKLILGERERIDINIIKRLVEERADPYADNDGVLVWAAETGWTDLVEYLIPFYDDTDMDVSRYISYDSYESCNSVDEKKALFSEALDMAAKRGHVETVKLLIPLTDPKIGNSSALRGAIVHGQIETVKILIPVSDPKVDDCHALRVATKSGYIEVVKLLIPISDVFIDSARIALINRYNDIFELLLPYCDLEKEASQLLEWASFHLNKEAIDILVPLCDPKVVEKLKYGF